MYSPQATGRVHLLRPVHTHVYKNNIHTCTQLITKSQGDNPSSSPSQLQSSLTPSNWGEGGVNLHLIDGQGDSTRVASHHSFPPHSFHTSPYLLL
ncbi:hypothetical protein FKM82_008386 [Ascaphus truei]